MLEEDPDTYTACNGDYDWYARCYSHGYAYETARRA
jgi:hypothetical protein